MKATIETIEKQVTTTVKEEVVNIQMTKDEAQFLRVFWVRHSIKDLCDKVHGTKYTDRFYCKAFLETFWETIKKVTIEQK